MNDESAPHISFFKSKKNVSDPGLVSDFVSPARRVGRLRSQPSLRSEFDAGFNDVNLFMFYALFNESVFKQFRSKHKRNVPEETLVFLAAAEELFTQLHTVTRNSQDTTNNCKSSSPQKLTLKRSSHSSSEPNRKNIFAALRANAMTFLLQQANQDPTFLLSAFRSFGERKHEAIEFFVSEQLACLVLPAAESAKNIQLASDVIQVITLCFETNDYAFHYKEFSIWLKILFQYMNYYKSMPTIFFKSSASILFLSLMSRGDVEDFVSLVKRLGMEQELFNRVIEQFSSCQNVSLARLLLSDFRKHFLEHCRFEREGGELKQVLDRFAPLVNFLREYNQVIFLFSLLELKNQFVDLMLVADPSFVKFIQSQVSVVGQSMYADLIDRLKLAFNYDYLAQDATDERQMNASQSLADQSKYTTPVFLSKGEIGSVVLARVLPGEKASKGAEWLQIYQEYLTLVVSGFLPHIEEHLFELAKLHVNFCAATIYIITSQESDRFDPEKYHQLSFLPLSIRQYCESNLELTHTIRTVREQMSEKYREINDVMGKTLRIGQEQDSYFRPVSHVAVQMLRLLPTNEPSCYPLTQFTPLLLVDALVLIIVEVCKEVNGVNHGICTELLEVCLDKSDENKSMYIKVSVAEKLVLEFKHRLGTLMSRDGTFPENCVTEDTIKAVVKNVCADLVSLVEKKRSVERGAFSARRKPSLGESSMMASRRKMSSDSDKSDKSEKGSFEDFESEGSLSSSGSLSRKSSLK